MPQHSRPETFARIGRSYPRIVLTPEHEVAESTLTRYAGRYAAIAGVVVLLGGLALLGWLLAR
ncbi:MAG TPA: hypothetical protein VFJ70_17510 [Burkholderiales bacterium]|nr:hypothetical protein [Burkholderiales bacterium]